MITYMNVEAASKKKDADSPMEEIMIRYQKSIDF